ncbi:hypothetical protein ZYGR_0A00200 [Zygosaccharomyces rouxii]|uniref:ZYRO0A00396p n=2 Tax=Zygosaccharomyces rouxii TaxID=4956 RepID=C5DP49_ZYGRC|nr:uncharacterized protein ZYRO0A00396g [Zygosaccharomyces rouxii]KAH9199022.1 hypothetical protein LQ764DRAFT_226475 [Zygosaccharomyces rouxii]GAV46429.1 hypothetical protein ZYGR_0A00200 [Zygosaccharomyces rouxii]CAR25460.1 ZYRO0A00396p [Zygosaccharomyces rouxii]
MVKSVIVTGVSRGIGRSIVEQIIGAGENAVVTGIARSESSLKSLKEQFGDKFFYVVGDVTDKNAASALVQEALNKTGKIDAVVANAGVLEPVQTVQKADVDGWKQLFDVNFFSVLSLATLAMPHLIKSQGNLVLVSSDACNMWFSGWGAYGASKAALNHLALTISKECDGVKAIAVAPGVVDTSMQDSIRENYGPSGMTPEAQKLFNDFKANGVLLDVKIPARVYANLALQGIPNELNGEYVSYDDKRLG